MKTEIDSLAQPIQTLVQSASPETIQSVAAVLVNDGESARELLYAKVISLAPNVVIRTQLEQLLQQWQIHSSHVNGTAIALALLAALRVQETYRHSPMLDLVWTGPETHSLALRRTDQALLQLIQEATTELLIVSFAVYKIPSISAAMVSAAQRGVTIRICLESPQASEGRIAYDTLRALGAQVAANAKIYIWPAAKRPQTADGKRGSLHAKVAVADRRTLLLSSANLTDYAMNLNMEMGVLVRGGTLPLQVATQFEELMVDDILASVET